MKDWRKLPGHLLDAIVENLSSSIDYLQFKAVCRSWNGAMMHHKVKRVEYYDHQIPMLLVTNETEDSLRAYDAVRGKLSKARLNISHKTRFCGSSQGWLASVNRDYTVTLHRPYFGVNKDGNNVASTISLPTIFPPRIDYILEGGIPEILAELGDSLFLPFEYHILKICVTANPRLHPKNCIIFAIYGYHNQLAFIRYTKDTKWSRIEDGAGYFDMMWHNNRLYAVHYSGRLESFEIFDDAGKPAKKSVLAPSYYGPNREVGKRYLVRTLDGMILLVDRHFEYLWEETPITRVTHAFEVFRLDTENNKWKKRRFLGDVAIFLGDNISISVRPSEYLGCRRDCIYFTQDLDNTFAADAPIMSDAGIYCLENKDFKLQVGLDPTMLGKKQPPIWVIP